MSHTLAAFSELVITDANASAAWIPLLLALKRAANESGTAIVAIHHASKKTGRYRDSTAIGAAVDAILEMEPTEDGSAVRRIRARAKWPMAEFCVRLEGDEYLLHASASLGAEARILLYIEEHPGCSKMAVRAAVGGRARDVDSWLTALESRGAVEDRGSGQRRAYYRTAVEGEHHGHQQSGQPTSEGVLSQEPAAAPLSDKGGQPGTSEGTIARGSGLSSAALSLGEPRDKTQGQPRADGGPEA